MKALTRHPKTAARQIGLLRVLVGDVTGAAAVLATSPGLGWSNPDHPGHTLFPLLAMLVSNGSIGDALAAELEATGRLCAHEPRSLDPEMGDGSPPTVLASSRVLRGAGASV